MADSDGETSATTGGRRTDVIPSSLQSILKQMDKTNDSLRQRIENLTTTTNAASARVLDLKDHVAKENECIHSLSETLTDILGTKTTGLTKENIQILEQALHINSFKLGDKRRRNDDGTQQSKRLRRKNKKDGSNDGNDTSNNTNSDSEISDSQCSSKTGHLTDYPSSNEEVLSSTDVYPYLATPPRPPRMLRRDYSRFFPLGNGESSYVKDYRATKKYIENAEKEKENGWKLRGSLETDLDRIAATVDVAYEFDTPYSYFDVTRPADGRIIMKSDPEWPTPH